MTTSPISGTFPTPDRTRPRDAGEGGDFADLLAQQPCPAPASERARDRSDAPDAQAGGSTAPANAPASPNMAVQAAPETIHSVNEKLLLQHSGTQANDSDAGAPGSGPAGGPDAPAAPVRTRPDQSGVKGERATAGAHDEAAAPSRASNEPVRESADGEQAQGGPRERGASTGSQSAGSPSQGQATDGAKLQEATSAAWQNAMARIMGPVARDASSLRAAAPGPPPAGGVQGAHRSAPSGTNARAKPAPGTTLKSVRAGAEAFESQVSRGVAAAMERGSGTLTLRLKPEALGQVSIKVQMKEGALTARFEARTPEARELLMKHTPELQRSLEAAGVKVAHIETVLSPEAQADGPGVGANGGGAESSSGGTPGERREPEHRMLTGDPRSSDGDAAGAGSDGGGGTSHWITLGLDTIA